jgi:hypothetical protein
MKAKRNVQALVRKQADKDAAAILKKVDTMLKQGIPRAKIEKALAKELFAHIKKQIRHVREPNIFERPLK